MYALTAHVLQGVSLLTPLGIFTRLHLRGNFPDVSLLAMGGLSIAASFLPLTVVIDTLITARILI